VPIKTYQSAAAKEHATLLQQKGLLFSGSRRACYSVAAKKPAAQWQQKSMLLSCCEKACCSVTEEKQNLP
jgi:hypothetical protein